MSLNASELFINEKELTEQNKLNNLKKIFTEKNENWHEAIFQKIEKLRIQENDNLMTCKWSHWITCHQDECKKHQCMKKWNQHYSQKFWKIRSQDKENWSEESLYETSMK